MAHEDGRGGLKCRRCAGPTHRQVCIVESLFDQQRPVRRRAVHSHARALHLQLRFSRRLLDLRASGAVMTLPRAAEPNSPVRSHVPTRAGRGRGAGSALCAMRCAPASPPGGVIDGTRRNHCMHTTEVLAKSRQRRSTPHDFRVYGTPGYSTVLQGTPRYSTVLQGTPRYSNSECKCIRERPQSTRRQARRKAMRCRMRS
jgi:hypothetical protein